MRHLLVHLISLQLMVVVIRKVMWYLRCASQCRCAASLRHRRVWWERRARVSGGRRLVVLLRRRRRRRRSTEPRAVRHHAGRRSMITQFGVLMMKRKWRRRRHGAASATDPLLLSGQQRWRRGRSRRCRGESTSSCSCCRFRRSGSSTTDNEDDGGDDDDDEESYHCSNDRKQGQTTNAVETSSETSRSVTWTHIHNHVTLQVKQTIKRRIQHPPQYDACVHISALQRNDDYLHANMSCHWLCTRPNCDLSSFQLRISAIYTQKRTVTI